MKVTNCKKCKMPVSYTSETKMYCENCAIVLKRKSETKKHHKKWWFIEKYGWNAWHSQFGEPLPVLPEEDEITKVCRKCFTEKLLEEFHRDRSNRDGHVNHCKKCQKKVAKTNKMQHLLL